MVATGHYVRTERRRRRAAAPATGRRPRQGPDLHAAHARAVAARAVAVPGRGAVEVRDPSACRARSGCRSRRSRTPRSSASRPSGDAGGVRPQPRARAGARRGRGGATPTDGCSASTTARSRSRSVSAAASGWRSAEPAYVVEVDAPRNRVVVGPGELLSRRGLRGRPCVVGRRRRHRPTGRSRPRSASATGATTCRPWSSRTGADAIPVTFRSPQRAIAPGQSAVVYRGDELLGGGRIVSSFR